MKRILNVGLSVCVGAWLVACDIGSSTPAPTGGAYPAPNVPAPTATTAAAPYPAPSSAARTTVVAPRTTDNVTLPAGVLAIYQRTGCFAGVNETLTIKADGTLEFTERGQTLKTAKVTPDKLNALNQLLAKTDFANLQAQYQAAGADLCTYRVTARTGDGKARVVTTMDAAKHPEILDQVLAELTKLRAEVR
jgi:hypothetical protein